MREQGAEVARTELLAGQDLFDRWEFQDHAEQRRQGTMAAEHLVVENQVLQLAALDRHEHNLVRRVDRRDDALLPRLHGQGADSAVAGADPAAKAEVFVYVCLLAAEAIGAIDLEGDHLDRADDQTAAATAAVRLHPGNEITGVNRAFMAETLSGKHRLATAGTAIADEVDTVLNIFTELDQILLPGFVQKFLAFATLYASCIFVADQRTCNGVKSHADFHLGVAGSSLVLALMTAVAETDADIAGCFDDQRGFFRNRGHAGHARC